MAGSSTAAATYTTSAGTVPQANPIILNARGIPANPIWIAGGQSLKLVIADSNDVVLQTIDGVTGVNDPASTASQDQWQLYTAAPTYISTTSFSVAGDQTSIFQVNRRVKTLNTGGTVYSTIRTSTFSAGLTTVTVVNSGSGVLDSGLSIASYGILSATDPSVPEIVGSAVTFSSGLTAVPASSTRYLGANGVVSAAETDCYWRVPFGGTVRAIYTQTPGNALGTRTYTVRKNAVDQAMTCASSGVSTQAQDTVNRFSVVAGDIITVKVVVNAGADATAHTASVVFVPNAT